MQYNKAGQVDKPPRVRLCWIAQASLCSDLLLTGDVRPIIFLFIVNMKIDA